MEFVAVTGRTGQGAEDTLAQIDTVNGFAYFVSDSSASPVAKIDLSTFEEVDTLQLPGEARGAAIDVENGFIYFAGPIDQDIFIWKVSLDTFTIVDTLPIYSSTVNQQASLSFGPAGYLYCMHATEFNDTPQLTWIDVSDFTIVDFQLFDISQSFITNMIYDGNHLFWSSLISFLDGYSIFKWNPIDEPYPPTEADSIRPVDELFTIFDSDATNIYATYLTEVIKFLKTDMSEVDSVVIPEVAGRLPFGKVSSDGNIYLTGFDLSNQKFIATLVNIDTFEQGEVVINDLGGENSEEDVNGSMVIDDANIYFNVGIAGEENGLVYKVNFGSEPPPPDREDCPAATYIFEVDFINAINSGVAYSTYLPREVLPNIIFKQGTQFTLSGKTSLYVKNNYTGQSDSVIKIVGDCRGLF